MSQKILRYIHVTGGACWKVKGILEITPREAVLNFGDFADDENQMFLWHGTKAVNLISILKDGFLVNPRNTSITGRLFGDVSSYQTKRSQCFTVRRAFLEPLRTVFSTAKGSVSLEGGSSYLFLFI
ncbi:hypothetical protein COOONC_12511 [Cooperia oncophora]